MVEEATFTPDWVSPPGDTIATILEERRVSPIEFARKISWNEEDITDLLEGRASVTEELARQLAAILGSSTNFWVRRERQFRQDVARLEQTASSEGVAEWLEEVPAKEMAKLGWIKPGRGTVGPSG